MLLDGQISSSLLPTEQIQSNQVYLGMAMVTGFADRHLNT